MAQLLYEIGTEELPAGYIEPALEQMKTKLRELLSDHRLEASSVQVAGTPRRLTIAADGVPERQAPEVQKTVGPPADVAYDDDGNPTQAAEGFARSQGVSVDDLSVEETEKGPYVAATKETEGHPTGEILREILRDLAHHIRFPKSMHWTSNGMDFARPIRWVVALLDDEVVPVALDDVKANRFTYGHSFLAPGSIELKDASFDDYVSKLDSQWVVVRPDDRRDSILQQINDLLGAGASVAADGGLLDEVVNLAEYPCAVEGTFNAGFLNLPDCALTAAMVEHQRYFPVRGDDGKLEPRFIFVMNRGPKQQETVREGNERVLTARLEDARFYWQQDRDVPLEKRVEDLEGVVFLGDLGNNLQRTRRLEKISESIADLLGLTDQQVGRCVRAALLCKADLLTGLVGEFPGLQGVVGGELARYQGEDEKVATAIAQHYRPAGTDDKLPETPEATVLSIADKLDVIAGCFSLDMEPTGSKDPYALRRNSQAILVMIEKKGLDVRLGKLLSLARDAYSDSRVECDKDTVRDIYRFFGERLYYMAVDRGHQHDFVRAVISRGFNNVRNFWARLSALQKCSKQDWWPDLVELVDRTYRIQKDTEDLPALNEDLLDESHEVELAKALKSVREDVQTAFEQEDYVRGAKLYAEALAEPVHEFFEEVFVNVDDKAVQLNRKRLCADIYHLFAASFADLYRIETAEEG